MSQFWYVTLAVLGALMACQAEAFEWRKSGPEQEGLSAEALQRMVQTLAQQRTEALMVIRHDKIVCEWYAPGFSRHTRHYTASLAKAIVGGMALLLAMDDGRISPDELACRYVRQWRTHPLKSRIMIRHLATHSSGLEDAEENGKPHAALKGWKGEFWRRKKNPILIARDEVPLLFEPGKGFEYSNPGMAMLGYCIAAALQGAPERDIKTLLAKRLMEPTGVRPGEWSISYGRSWKVDGVTVHAIWGGGAYSPDAVARVGRLMLREGDWDGRRLVRAETVRAVVADAGMPTPDRSKGPVPRMALCWWVNSDGVFARLPRDAYFGSGAGHQLLVVIPSLDMIVVRMGQKMAGDGHWAPVEKYLFNPLMNAVTDARQGRVIKEVHFEPVQAIRRGAVGSDNWPITWGDDGCQYAAYGDGWGFDSPRVEKKLSLGFAKITGPPSKFRGINIRSSTGERYGDGPKGPKASGMLMVDGVLYMWVRNVGNSQLAWSVDHGKTWEWGFKFAESFGCPTFLNFGPNYSGARDDFVYTFSPDGPSAYESYDRVVLARVHKSRIRERSAYEFFAGLDENGQPVWTRDIGQRAGVLELKGQCGRLDVVYNSGLKRYLMAMGYNHAGGWGLFEAPEPWGPWLLAFSTERWDVGDTHSYRLPAKWISRDGRRMYVVFSGRKFSGIDYDAFCVRGMRLVTYADE